MFFLFFLFSICLSEVLVELHIFSGTKNPQWYLSESSISEVVSSIPSSFQKKRTFPNTQKMGYRGFSIRTFNSASFPLELSNDFFLVFQSPEFELSLLKSMPLSTPHYHEIVKHSLLRILDDENEESIESRVEEIMSASNDDPKIIGGDTVYYFDPRDWNYDPVQYNNNCYDYSTYVQTNTFAQPGKGSGKVFTYNTCDDVIAAAQRDGLVLYNDPSSPPIGTMEPSKGHYVALVMWPDTNFHWIRKDNTTYWSHKPGETPARDVDNSGNKITNPQKADFSPWTEFCGYFTVVPSEITIK